MKRHEFCLMLWLAVTTSGRAAIIGSIIPDSISPVQAPEQTRTYTLDYCSTVTGGSGKADVLFLIDTTRSMEIPISSIRTSFGDILSTIATELPGMEVEYAIADYKDYRDGRNYTKYGVTLREGFTSDIHSVQLAIDSMYAVDGYDHPEAQLKAMVSLANNWMTPSGDLGFNGRADAQKIVIWLGDREGHYYGEGGDGPPYYYPSLADTLAALNKRGIPTFGLNADGEGKGIDANYGGANQATYLTTGTGGRLFNDVVSPDEVYAAVVDAIMAGIEVYSNITLAMEGSENILIEPLVHTRIGSWTPDDGDICGSFTFEITSPSEPGIVDFDLVLLGNGAELDRMSVHLTTTPEPAALLLLSLGSLGLLRKRETP